MNTASRKWLRPALIIAAAVVLLVIVLVTRPPDTSPTPKEPAAVANVEKSENPPDAVFPEVEVYAQHYGITVGEALRRFEIQEAFAGLDTELSIEEAETFAGLYIQHEPEFRIVALFTRDGEETIKPYIPDGMAGYFEVRTVEVSYLELQNTQNEVSSVLKSLGIPTDSSIDIKENNVRFYVTDLAPVETAITNGSLTIPDYVDIIEVEALAQPD